MSRCTRKTNLEIHHKSVSGGAGLSNAKVLCQKCHLATLSYGRTTHNSPPPFSEDIKKQALQKAGHRCECERGADCCQNGGHYE